MADPRLDLARYLRSEPASSPPSPRAPVYRRLVWNSYRSVLGAAFPITRALLGPEGFEALLAELLAAGGPKTSLYRDIPGELVAHALTREHPFADLLQHEWLELVAARHPADLDAWARDPATPGLARGAVRPNPSLQLGVYTRPVHTLTEDADADALAERTEPFAVLQWRRPDTDEVVLDTAGLLLVRALALAAVAPTTVDALVAQLSAEVPSVPAADLRAALEGFFTALAARDGVLR